MTMTVEASSASTRASSGVLSPESRTTRIGEAPGTSRTVSCGSSRTTVPTPTSTASHAARSACEARRSGSPLIHRASPVEVAIRPSSVWAYFTTTYGRVGVERTSPRREPTSGGGPTPSGSGAPRGATCPITDCLVARYRTLRACAAVGRPTTDRTAIPAASREAALSRLLDISRTDRTPNARRHSATSPKVRSSTWKPRCSFASAVSNPASCSMYARSLFARPIPRPSCPVE